jgi:phosphoglycolate phosphatase-like HAD superfamily hydrolase
MHLAVFDIDGTLVDSDEWDGILYAEAIQKVLNQDIDCTWSRYASVTDSGILDEILDETHLRANRQEIHSNAKAEFIRLTEEYVAETPNALKEIPGATGLIKTLLRQSDVEVAVATGGWRETAELKLRGIGLDPKELPLATSSESSDRCRIIRLAERRALNGKIPRHRTYFGDGVWDKKAAAELDYSFVAVGPRVPNDMVLPDLSDHETILAYLRG